MMTPVDAKADVGPATRSRQAPGSLRNLWGIGQESFRTLISARYRPRPAGGATDAERRKPMLGDPVLVRPTRVIMRAADIGREADDVWPWLAQMMRGGGIYGWPALETPRCRSADSLLDGLAPPRVGDRVGDLLEVAILDPPREIVWHAPAGLELLGFEVRALALDYLLRPGPSGGCRLLVRMSGCCERLTSQVRGYLCELIDFLLPWHQVETIRGLAEAHARRPGPRRVDRDPAGRHQALDLEPGPGAAPGAPSG
jgi:hypothetical protein